MKKFYSDGYATIVAESIEDACELAESQQLCDAGTAKEYYRELKHPEKKTMIYPVEDLPEGYLDPEKHEINNLQGCYFGIDLDFVEAARLHELKETKAPYVLCLSEA